MPKKIIQMNIEEVSSVDNPANAKEFLVIKNMEEEEEVNKNKNKETNDQDKGGEENMDLEKIKELLKDNEDAVEFLENEFSKLENTEGEEEGEEDTPEIDINKKDLPDEIKKQIEKMESEIKATKELAKKEREARLEIEFSKKAEKFNKVAERDTVMTVLRKAHENGFGEEIEKMLKTAQERIQEGNIEKEKGDGGEPTDTNVLEKKVSEYLEDHDVTEEQAMVKVLERNPDLYTDYLNN